MFICVQTHTQSCPHSPIYMHTLTLTHILTLLTHLNPSSFSIMAIITTWKWSEVLEAPGYLWHCSIHLEPCTASSTWWNALTTCGINNVHTTKWGTISGAWVYECVRALSWAQGSEFKSVPSLTDCMTLGHYATSQSHPPPRVQTGTVREPTGLLWEQTGTLHRAELIDHILFGTWPHKRPSTRNGSSSGPVDVCILSLSSH